MDLEDHLKTMISQKGSDLYLTVGAYPSLKINGKITPIAETPIAPGEVITMAKKVLDEKQWEDFESVHEMNLSWANPIGRFRVNVFRQKTEVGMVIRSIATEIPSLDSLKLPRILKEVILSKRGLFLVVGATGSGKSTSLASLIDYRNAHAQDHIITIEDPVEFVHSHKKSIITQREVGIDTLNYREALKNTLRQAPDVISIGEIRAAETMEYAIAFAETGHLCLSTLHANNANQALDRIVNFFPEAKHKQVLMDLSLNIRAIMSQRLIPTLDGKRVAAVEILLGTPLIADLIRKGEFAMLKEAMDRAENQGMQTFDMSLVKLCKNKQISEEEAILNADSQNNVRLQLRITEHPKDKSKGPKEPGGLSIDTSH